MAKYVIPQNRSIRLTELNKQLGSFVRSNKLKAVEYIFLKSVEEYIKKLYMSNTFFKTGTIQKYLLEHLELKSHSVHMGVPDNTPYERGSWSGSSKETRDAHSFLYTETGWTTRPSLKHPERPRVYHPPVNFFRDIVQATRQYVKDLAETYFADIVCDLFSPQNINPVKSVAKVKESALAIFKMPNMGKANTKSSGNSRGRPKGSGKSRDASRSHGSKHDNSLETFKKIRESFSTGNNK